VVHHRQLHVPAVTVWLLLVVGCGDNHGAAGDEPASQPALDPAVLVAPTYHRDVAPILSARCGGCHTEGGVGPFPLTSYTEARDASESIARATTARVMPPWPADASGACGTFVDPRWLGEAEIATLATWHANGAPAGDAGERFVPSPPQTPFTATVELGSNAGYQVRPGPDEYRCFVVDPGLASDRYITAIAMQLDQAEVVHHMQLYAADDAIGEQSISAREAEDPEPGYACDNEGVGQHLRYIGVWAAGDLVRRWPDGTGIQIHGGHRIVMQLHYHNHGSQPVVDQTRVALELADAVEHAGSIDSASGFPLILPPGQPDVTVTSEKPFGRDGFIRGARIHMHTLGTHGRIELVRDGQASCVLDIPRWDFGWQLFYRFAEPIPFTANDNIRISCSYDTRSRSDTVTWGIRTEDEMCLGYTFLTP
jgi:hypothetical protein